MLDCARCHISVDIANKAAALGIWMCFVPARLTWLLQPLDIMVFRSFKARFRHLYTEKRSSKFGGVLDTFEWVQVVADTVKHIFQDSDWSRAFDSSGLTNAQRSVSEWIRAHVSMNSKAYRPRVLKNEELQSLGGRRVTMPWQQLFRPPLQARSGAQLVDHCSGPQFPQLALHVHAEAAHRGDRSAAAAAEPLGSRPASSGDAPWPAETARTRRWPVAMRLGPPRRDSRSPEAIGATRDAEQPDGAIDQKPEQAPPFPVRAGSQLKSQPQPWDKVSIRIADLQKQRQALKVQAKAAAKEMKKAQRQKRRTAKNAKKLTDEELVQIVLERQISERVAMQGAASNPSSGSNGMDAQEQRGA